MGWCDCCAKKETLFNECRQAREPKCACQICAYFFPIWIIWTIFWFIGGQWAILNEIDVVLIVEEFTILGLGPVPDIEFAVEPAPTWLFKTAQQNWESGLYFNVIANMASGVALPYCSLLVMLFAWFYQRFAHGSYVITIAVLCKWSFYTQYVNVVNGLASAFRLNFNLLEPEVRLPGVGGEPGAALPVEEDSVNVAAALATSPGAGAFYNTMACLFLIAASCGLVWAWVSRPDFQTFRNRKGSLVDKLLPGTGETSSDPHRLIRRSSASRIGRSSIGGAKNGLYKIVYRRMYLRSQLPGETKWSVIAFACQALVPLVVLTSIGFLVASLNAFTLGYEYGSTVVSSPVGVPFDLDLGGGVPVQEITLEGIGTILFDPPTREYTLGRLLSGIWNNDVALLPGNEPVLDQIAIVRFLGLFVYIGPIMVFPLLQLGSLLVVWFVPMRTNVLSNVFLGSQIITAWCAHDVFAVCCALTMTRMRSLSASAAETTCPDTIPVPDNPDGTPGDCFVTDGTLGPGFWYLVAGVLLQVVVNLYIMLECTRAIMDSVSEEDATRITEPHGNSITQSIDAASQGRALPVGADPNYRDAADSTMSDGRRWSSGGDDV